MTLLWTVQRWSGGGGSYNEENQEAKQQKSKGVIKFDKRKFYVQQIQRETNWENWEPGCIERKKVQQTYTLTHARIDVHMWLHTCRMYVYFAIVSYNNGENYFVAKRNLRS